MANKFPLHSLSSSENQGACWLKQPFVIGLLAPPKKLELQERWQSGNFWNSSSLCYAQKRCFVSGSAMLTVKTRMIVLGGAVCALALLLARPLVPVFLYNPWINATILLAFLGGMILPFVFIQKLATDQKTWRLFKSKDPTGIISQKGLLASLLVDAEGKFKTAFSNDDVALVLSGVERKLAERHTVGRYLMGVLILLGLLGTFIGLTQTVSAISGSIKGMAFDGAVSADAFQHLKDSIQMPLSGMGVAFSSSIFGLIGSLILGVFDLLQGKAEKDFYDDLESTLMTFDKKRPILAETSGPAYVMALLEQTAENLGLLERRLVQMEESHARIAGVWEGVSESMATTATQSERTQNVLEAMLRTQETSLNVLQRMDEGRGKEAQAMILTLKRTLEDAMTGRLQMTQDLRSEIRMIVKTLSVLSEPEDDFLASVHDTKNIQQGA